MTFIGHPGWGIWIIVGVFTVQMMVLGIFILMAIAQEHTDGREGREDDGGYKNE